MPNKAFAPCLGSSHEQQILYLLNPFKEMQMFGYMLFNFGTDSVNNM